jgi:hypothetical protein
MGKKATDAEINARIAKVYSLLLNGQKRRGVLQYAAKNEWGISDRQVDEYIKRATVILQEQSKEELDYARAMSINRHDDLYFRSMSINDFKTALAIQKSRDEISGVRNTGKMEVTGKNGEPVVVKVIRGVDLDEL